MAFNYGNPGLRSQIIQEIETSENEERKGVSLGQYEIFRDRILPYVRRYLEGFYSKNTIKEMPIVSTINLARRIASQEAAIYKTAPTREFKGVSEAQEIALKKLYEEMQVNALLMKANAFYKLQDQCTLQVRVANGKLKLIVLLAHQLDVVPSQSDPETADAYIVNGFDRSQVTPKLNKYEDDQDQTIADSDDYKANLNRFAFWSKDFNFITDKNGNIVSGQDVANPIGILPFIDIFAMKDGEFWVRSGAALTDFTIHFNASMTDLFNIIRMQGFGQAWFSGAENMMPENLQIGPNFVLRLPVDPNNPVPTQFGFANANADLGGSIQALESLLSAFLTSRGVDPKTVNGKGESKSFNSGLERMLAMIQEFEPSRSDFDVFKRVESDLFNVLKAFINTYGGTDVLKGYNIGTIPEGATVEVAFAKPEMIATTAETLDNVSRKLDLGVITQIDAIMEVRGVTRQEAEEINEAVTGIDAAAPTDKLNGAQVSGIAAIVEKVAAGLIPRDSGVKTIALAFGIDEERADALLADAGGTFVPAAVAKPVAPVNPVTV